MEEAPSDIFEVGSLNSQTLHDAVSQYPTLSEFLQGEERMCFHSTYMEQPEYHLTYNFDIDGLVVELESATSLLAPIHYLLLPRIQVHMLQDSYKFLKKHVDLTQCTPLGISALRNSSGYTIGYVDGGYHLSIMFLPIDLQNPDSRLTKKSLYNIYACEMFNCIVCEFQKELKAVKGKDKCRPTIQKQVSTNTSRYHVLKRDMCFILHLLDKAIKNIGVSHLLKPTLYLTMFGQKDREALDVSDLVAPRGATSLSVHTACKISATDPNIHLLFSRCGLQDLVGPRGSLYSILGIHEATNYQTDLDHLPHSLSPTLLDALGVEGKLTFLQLYVDSPHVHLQMPYKHPVSGTLVTCRMSHPQFQRSLLSRASQYMCHMEDLKEKLVQLGLRIEQVRRFEKNIPWEIDPQEYFCQQALYMLFG